MRLDGLRNGPLGQPRFRLLILGRTTSLVGSAFATIALAFAVLAVSSSKADLGYVLAARGVPQVIFVLFGGVWADRLPRNVVMVASSYVSGGSQAAAAALLLSGNASAVKLGVLAALSGASEAFFYPASTGIVPQTVPPSMLQSANAVLRLGSNGSAVIGTALGGIVVAAISPGAAIAVDAASFFASAFFIRAIRLPTSLRMASNNVLWELRDGWRVFASRPWLWAIVARDSFINFAKQSSLQVLGPIVALESLGGATAWAAVSASLTLGFIIGGFVMLRYRPARFLVAGTLALLLTYPVLLGLAIPLPLAAIVALAALSGLGSEVFGVLWDTAMQQHIPPDALSRVSSYDVVGSWSLMPLGMALIGPIAATVGLRATLYGAAALCTVVTLAVLVIPDVRRMGGVEPSPDSLAEEAR